VSNQACTLSSAEPLLQRFPSTPVHTWPMEPLAYLGTMQRAQSTPRDRHEWSRAHWDAADPKAVMGAGGEPFVDFMRRVSDFAERVRTMRGHGIVFGHGSFLMAYLIALEQGFDATAETMARFKSIEDPAPLPHGCIVSLHRARLLAPWVSASRVLANSGR
jgi:broad specificity phosphatase PhoE